MGLLPWAGGVATSVSSDDGEGEGGEDRGDSVDGDDAGDEDEDDFGDDAGDADEAGDGDDFGEDEGDGEDFGDADGASSAMAMPLRATKTRARTTSWRAIFF